MITEKFFLTIHCWIPFYPETAKNKWTLTREVPAKLPQAPPAPLGVTYNNNKIVNAQIIPSDDMLKPPVLDWNAKSGELYTIFLIDFGIERLEGLQWVHWLVSNVKDGDSIKQGDEVIVQNLVY